MKALVSRIENTVLRPQPIQKFTTGRLHAEVASLERLLVEARAANEARYVEIYHAQIEADIRGEPLSSSVRLTVTHDYVVRDQLRDLLALRLQLCRSELSRRSLAGNRNRRR